MGCASLRGAIIFSKTIANDEICQFAASVALYSFSVALCVLFVTLRYAEKTLRTSLREPLRN